MLVSDSGDLLLFDHIHNDGLMWSGTGEREVRHHVRFQTEFTDVPHIMLSVQMIDGDSKSNLRLDLNAVDIDTQGFCAVARTWKDTSIGRLRIAWIALGPGFEDQDEYWRV